MRGIATLSFFEDERGGVDWTGGRCRNLGDGGRRYRSSALLSGIVLLPGFANITHSILPHVSNQFYHLPLDTCNLNPRLKEFATILRNLHRDYSSAWDFKPSFSGSRPQIRVRCLKHCVARRGRTVSNGGSYAYL